MRLARWRLAPSSTPNATTANASQAREVSRKRGFIQSGRGGRKMGRKSWGGKCRSRPAGLDPFPRERFLRRTLPRVDFAPVFDAHVPVFFVRPAADDARV